MKIRALTIGITIYPDDFKLNNSTYPLKDKLYYAKEFLDLLEIEYQNNGYEVQTKRISFNSIDEWLNDIDLNNSIEISNRYNMVLTIVNDLNISFVNLGGCENEKYYEALLIGLKLSTVFSGSIRFSNKTSNSVSSVCPDYQLCLKAAEVSINLFKSCGDLGNFRYCTSFNCPSNIPFFPASYHHVSPNNSKTNLLSIGLENGDLLFMGFFGCDTINEGRQNLVKILNQSLILIQNICVSFCDSYCKLNQDITVDYHGIDASVNPGLSTVDSVGNGIETLLNINNETDLNKFGSFGTLSAVSAITSAIKSVQNDIKIVGYSGLMLPVMEDVCLASRAIVNNYSLRDLLLFSSVCGVGLDTVPVPGDITAEKLAHIYLEVGTLSFRLNKPLSCRLLPITNKTTGDITEIDSPYLTNTRIFSIS